jgi:DNA polymerase-3 subunit epsilon
LSESQFQLGFDSFEQVESPKVARKPRPKAKVVAAPVSPVAPTLTLEAMAATLEKSADYKVLRRLQPVLQFARQSQGECLRVIVLDTETTGLDHASDKIIELAMLQVDVDRATGLPVGDVQVYDGLEDPGMLISAEIQAITGISNEMVSGQSLDLARITQLLQGVDLVIAHNAAFDRPFCEARLPAFAKLSWACSFAEIDWKKEGHGSSKLEYLALEKGWFYEAHRAEVDCHALLAVLAETLPSSQHSGLARLVAQSRVSSYRLQANQAPFETKDLLKARGYRWNAEQRVWQIRLDDETQLASEYEWLKASVYGGRPARVLVEKMSPTIKYSHRAGEMSMAQI